MLLDCICSGSVSSSLSLLQARQLYQLLDGMAGDWQVPVVSEPLWPLLLVDRVCLPGCELDVPDEGAELCGMPMAMWADPAMPDRILCCTTSRAFSIALPWIPLVASHLSEGGLSSCYDYAGCVSVG